MKEHECPKCGTSFTCDVPLTPEGQRWHGIDSVVGTLGGIVIILLLLVVCNAGAIAHVVHGS